MTLFHWKKITLSFLKSSFSPYDCLCTRLPRIWILQQLCLDLKVTVNLEQGNNYITLIMHSKTAKLM